MFLFENVCAHGPNRGQCVAARECDELFRPGVEQCDGRNSNGSYLLLNEGCEGRLEITFIASFDDHQFPPERMRRGLRISRVGLGIRNVCVHKKADHGGMLPKRPVLDLRRVGQSDFEEEHGDGDLLDRRSQPP